jgi:hypothetical protein
VASYFCLSDGTVVHAVAGPLDANQFLREAKWAVEVRKLAMTEAGGDVSKYRATVRKAHLERLSAEQGVSVPLNALPRIAAGQPPVPAEGALRTPAGRRTAGQGQVHVLLAYYPLPKLSQLYPIVFVDILKEKLSTLPVRTQ